MDIISIPYNFLAGTAMCVQLRYGVHPGFVGSVRVTNLKLALHCEKKLLLPNKVLLQQLRFHQPQYLFLQAHMHHHLLNSGSQVLVIKSIKANLCLLINLSKTKHGSLPFHQKRRQKLKQKKCYD